MSLPAAPRRGVVFTEEMRLAWLRLIRSENVGPVTFRELINRYGSAAAALEALPDLAARGGRRIVVCGETAAAEEMARAQKLGARFVCLGEPDYPRHLRTVDHAPPVLALMGDAGCFDRPALAIVGARNASLSGIKLTRIFATGVGSAGFVVVSGLARGIDAAAHDAALATGTVGVFAGGLDRPYPQENRPLMRQIIDHGGALVSEMPFGWTARAIDFPRRNRLVAGLSLGLLVVEAALRSGSLISARLAGELGRLVFAVPGSPLDPRAAGANRLIRDGAILACEPADVLEALTPLAERADGSEDGSLDEPARDGPPLEGLPLEATGDEPVRGERERIVETLGPTPVAIDEIIAHTGSSPGIVQLVLLELDLAGRLERHPSGMVSLLL
ncbi:DNA-processing protein DprA [Aurantimonas sp. 22II-16-19i]|uniref:DNA-processing protein DprA n=1 Tax=Aurantimonas sp. 22II-16-19i TaxID=1317114 RepID=UPI0009F7CD4E|nr:DNA-processing protein DprA [Aurantimonas sp. 22II-16-19i]ORE99008.1 DNA protecting protein DprA [Aurantimonas sp. 22II-16-19i]